MKRASVTEAKNGLSSLLDRVRHGETVIIEDRGVPVAALAPVSQGDAATDNDRLIRLERDGVLRPARVSAPSKRLLAPPPRPRRPVALSRRVVAERGEGW